VASIDDPASLERAIAGSAAVLNCAGPFLDTAPGIIDAALRARVHYLDVTAEQMSALRTFERFETPGLDLGVVIAPAMGFYGGLGDLLATAAMSDWADADELDIAVGLDSWWPTLGTRLTGERNVFRRYVFSGGKLEFAPDPRPRRTWTFPAPLGKQEVELAVFSEIITISRHLRSPEIHSYMNLAPLEDVNNPNTPEPTATDESGRSAQTFVLDVIVRKGGKERHASARGRDIYAVTAPIVVEVMEWILDGRAKTTGTATAGELVDARGFLEALSPEHVDLEFR
jgi:hypothetical protein